MGFRKDSYATVWMVEPTSDTLTRARISISRKNKNTGEYETDFNGFVSFTGTAAARKASLLKERDRIRLGDVDVSTRYDKEKNTTYTTFKIFSFEKQEDGRLQSDGTFATGNSFVDDGEVDDSRLPF